jgi:hypothetical protein
MSPTGMKIVPTKLHKNPSISLKIIWGWRTQTWQYNVRFEVFTAVTMKNAVFWDVAPCTSCVNRRFGGKYRLHLHGRKIRERGTSVSRWLQANSIWTDATKRVL